MIHLLYQRNGKTGVKVPFLLAVFSNYADILASLKITHSAMPEHVVEEISHNYFGLRRKTEVGHYEMTWEVFQTYLIEAPDHI